MKKKFLITLLVVMTFVCLFTIAVSAEDKIVSSTSDAYGELTVFDEAIGNTQITNLKDDGTIARTVLWDGGTNYYTIPTVYTLIEHHKNRGDGVEGEMFNLYFEEISAKLGFTVSKNSIIRIEFPSDIKFICNGNENLSGCANMVECIMNDGVYFWDNGQRKAFTNCKKLKLIDISGMIIDQLQGPYSLFEYCEELEYVKLPNAYQKADGTYMDYATNYMFHGCKKLKTIDNMEGFFKGDKILNYRTFSNCYVLEKIILPEGLEKIEGRAIGCCKAITSIIIPDTVNEIGTNETVFESCTALKKVVFPSGAVSVGDYCFEKCTALTDVWMPGAGSTFAKQVFGQCGNSLNVNFYFQTAQSTITISNSENNKDPFITALNSDSDTRIKYNTPLSTKCTVFLGGHKAAAEGEYQFLGDSYVTEYAFVTPCSHGCGFTTNVKACDALITNKGYSVNTIDGVGITYTIVFNPTAIKKYEELAKTTFEYGLIAATTNVVEDGVLFDATGTAVDKNAIVTGFAGTEYTIYNLKITSIPEESQETGIYACAYVIDTSDAGVKTINYIGDSVTTVAEAVTYRAISQKESTNS